MARHFVAASSQRLTRASTPVTTYPLTLACWVRPTTVSSTQTALSICSSGTNNQHTLAITSGAKVLYEVVTAGVAQDAIGTTNITAAAWHHIAAVGTSATSRQAYRDGVADGSNTTSGTPASIADVEIGNLLNTATHTSFFNGDVAEAAIWNVALTQAEITMLALGVSPLLIRPASLVFYAPLRAGATVEQDYKNATGLTVTGATVTDHPHVLLPRDVLVAAVAAAAAGASSVTGIGAIASLTAFGVVDALRRIGPTGAGSGQAFGTTTQRRITAPPGLATAETFGTTKSVRLLSAAAIGSGQAFGTTRLLSPQWVTGAGQIASLETFGQAARIVRYLGPAGIVTGQTFGIPQLRRLLGPAAVASLEAFGITRAVRLIGPSGIASLEAFGRPTELGGSLSLTQITGVGAIASLEAFGGADRLLRLLGPTGAVSGQAFGSVKAARTIGPTGIVSAAGFGGTDKVLRLLFPAGVASGEAFGRPTEIGGILGIYQVTGVGAIGSLEAFGTDRLIRYLGPAGAQTGQIFGTTDLLRTLGPAGILSQAALGSPAGRRQLAAVGAATGEAFGTGRLIRILAAVAAASGQTFGRPTVSIIPIGGIAPTAYGYVAICDGVVYDLIVTDRDVYITGISDLAPYGITVEDTEAFAADGLLTEPFLTTGPTLVTSGGLAVGYIAISDAAPFTVAVTDNPGA